MDSSDSKESSLKLSNLSLDVPDDLFIVPKDYKKVEIQFIERAIAQNKSK